MINWRDLAAIPGFQPSRALAAGGQGLAVLGMLDGREVVVKALDPILFNAAAWDQAKAVTTLTHPNVIHIDAVGTIDINGVPLRYTVMPYIQGPSLRKLLNGGVLFTLKEAAEYGAQIADGLAALHELGRTHRDIKPDNLLIDAPAHQIKIIDLELVHYDGFDELTGRWMFSPGYAAKEVAASNSYSSRSDLFALGVVLYELIAGVHPYAAPTPAERQSLILAGGRAKALLARNPQVPREMSQLVARLLSPRIAERPASATDVARQLREASISPAQLVSDVALGVRMGNRSAKLLNAHLGDAWIDLLVAEARQLPGGFNGANWREMGPALLIDPCTDRIAAGEATPTFLRRVAVWGWAHSEISSALVNGGADDETTAYILAWQMGHSVSGLITPYLRIDSFDATGSSGLRRTLDLARASMRARTKEGWREPLLVGVAVAGAIVTDGQRRDEILASLTELDVDGFYVVLEARGSEEGYLRACREFGETLRGHGRITILAHAGPELVPLLAGGSWDVAVTGVAQSNRRADFKGQGGGNAGVPRRRLLAHALLEELEEAQLFDVADRAASLLRCSCSSCRRLFPVGRPFSYDRTAAAHHYIASLQAWVQDVRDQPPTRRASWIRELFDETRREVREIDLRLPAGSRLGGVAHLRDWQDWLT